MALKEPTSNSLFVFLALVGAYQLGKKSKAKSEQPSHKSEMVSPPGNRWILTSLLSLSYFSRSTTAFSPPQTRSISPIVNDQKLDAGQSLACSAQDEIENVKVQQFEEGKKSENDNTSATNINEKKMDGNERRELTDEKNLLDSITMQPVGHISSVYRLCVGTPRQGLLAPNSRGRLDLYPNRIASDSILDLDKFSHVWVVFIFHLNSNAKSVEKSKQTIEKGKVVKRQFPSKIKPPALGGKRVGIFATRSPHRPNPIGFSLCKIDKIVIPPKKKHQKASETPYHVYVSGLDLVDGTPVLDIKPYVPHYDSVGYMYEEGMGVDKEATLPKWVSDGLGKRKAVDFSEEADEQLKRIVIGEDAKDLEFYGKSTGRDESDEDALDSIKTCITEVLSVDVRSKWQTSKARKGKSRAETASRVKEAKQTDDTVTATKTEESVTEKTAKICTQQLDNLLIKFRVQEGKLDSEDCAVDTQGSGADDSILVLGIEFIPKKK
jgi:tRNA-Thr(GGU) m(6)t(6)A37 methyltransferase TsaA